MNYKEGQSRNQMMMSSMDMMIAPDNPVRLIELMTKQFISDNQVVINRKSSKGNRNYCPSVFLNLFIYGYMNGISSSRKLEREALLNIELRWLLEGLTPDHWVINHFRKENGELIKSFSKWLKGFLKSNNYIEGKRIVIDGTKIKAYASPDVLSEKRLNEKIEKTTQKLKEYLSSLDVADNQEEKLSVAQEKISELEERLKKLETQKQQVKESEKTYYAPNDPDASLVKSRQGKKAGYNGQAGVDPKHHLIVMDYVSDKVNDIDELTDGVEQTQAQSGIQVEEVVADKGYAHMEQILELQEQGVQCYIPTPTVSQDKQKKQGLEFCYDKSKDLYICPAGKHLTLKKENFRQRNQYYNRYQASYKDCRGCSFKAKCSTAKRGKTIDRNIQTELIEAYKEGLKTTHAKEIIAQRKTVVEHPFGTIKMWMGKLEFLVTGRQQVETEFSLYSTAYNIRRLLNIAGTDKLMAQMQANCVRISEKTEKLFLFLRNRTKKWCIRHIFELKVKCCKNNVDCQFSYI